MIIAVIPRPSFTLHSCQQSILLRGKPANFSTVNWYRAPSNPNLHSNGRSGGLVVPWRVPQVGCDGVMPSNFHSSTPSGRHEHVMVSSCFFLYLAIDELFLLVI